MSLALGRALLESLKPLMSLERSLVPDEAGRCPYEPLEVVEVELQRPGAVRSMALLIDVDEHRVRVLADAPLPRFAPLRIVIRIGQRILTAPGRVERIDDDGVAAYLTIGFHGARPTSPIKASLANS